MPNYETIYTSESDVVELIVNKLDTMPEAMARVGHYCSTYPERVVNQSIVELGSATNTGQATIIRFCRALGFSGFRDIKLALVDHMANERGLISGHKTSTSNIDVDRLNASIQSSIQKTSQLVASSNLNLIAQKIAAARHVIVYGGGASGICASLLEFRLIRLGFPVFALENNRLAFLAAQGLPKGGMAVAISFSGKTKETIEFLKAAKTVGAETLVLTACKNGQITKIADQTLPFHLTGTWPVEGSIRFVAPFLVVVEALANVLANS